MKSILYTTILLFSITLLRAQDIHFSQFGMAPLLQNPAMAGAVNNFEARLNYRNQWGSIGVPYKTYAASIDARMKKKKSKTGYWGLGFNFYNDESGDARLSSTVANISTTYHVTINPYNHLGFGFQTGMGQRSINTANFQWGSQFANGNFNASLPSGESFESPSFMYLDLSGGLVYSYNNTAGRKKVMGNNFNQGTMGFSIFHFNRPQYSFNRTGERLYIKYVAHGDFLFSLPGTKFALNPGFLFYSQGPNKEILLGAMIRYDLIPESKYTGAFNGGGIYAGAYVRARDAVVVATRFEIGDYAIGLSYDINTSTLRSATGGRGGLEVSLRYINRSIRFGAPAKY
jgi:type IX secretion system PorP/SprF family membrane protein